MPQGIRCCSCDWCSTMFRKPIRFIMGLAEIGLAVAIVVVVAIHLTDFDTTLEGQVTNYQCLLGTTDSGDDICVYTYVVSGIAIGAAIYLMISVIFTCACWMYVDFILDFIVAVLAAILWFVAAAVITDYNNNKVQNETDVQKNWRNSVTTMAWVLFALFCADAIGSTFRFCYKACGCCGGYESSRLKEVEAELKKKDEELATVKNQLDAYTKPQPQAMQLNPDAAIPGAVAVTMASNADNGKVPEESAPSKAPEVSAPSKGGAYPPVPPAGAVPP